MVAACWSLTLLGLVTGCASKVGDVAAFPAELGPSPTVAVLPVLPISEDQFTSGYARTEAYLLRVLYAPRLVDLRTSSSTGAVLAAAREGLSRSLQDRGFQVLPTSEVDPRLGLLLRQGEDVEPPPVEAVGRALDADLLLFAWTDQYEGNRGLTGIQRSRFSLAVHLVDARSGERLWVHQERRTSGYEVGESMEAYVQFVEGASHKVAVGVPSPRPAPGEAGAATP